jgi:hypothetical protein
MVTFICIMICRRIGAFTPVLIDTIHESMHDNDSNHCSWLHDSVYRASSIFDMNFVINLPASISSSQL